MPQKHSPQNGRFVGTSGKSVAAPRAQGRTVTGVGGKQVPKTMTNAEHARHIAGGGNTAQNEGKGLVVGMHATSKGGGFGPAKLSPKAAAEEARMSAARHAMRKAK